MGGTPSTRALGRAVAELRHRAGHSQAGLAAITGLHRAYIGGIERGQRNPTWNTLAILARGLGASLSDVVLLAEALDDDADAGSTRRPAR